MTGSGIIVTIVLKALGWGGGESEFLFVLVAPMAVSIV